MRLEDLTGRRLALLGLGIDVRASVGPILGVDPASVVVVDADATSSSVVLDGVELPVVGIAEACAESQVLVRSPGFPRYRPELIEARNRGVAMTTPVDLFLGGLRDDQQVVLITGTKGKSTTTDLIDRFAERAGLRVGVAGNLGIPVFEDGWDSDAPIIVLEVSSYQAADLHHRADIAVITAISEDHLSWHGGLDTYLSDKLRVVANDGGVAGTVVVPRAEARAREVLAERLPDLQPMLVDDIAAAAASSVPAHRRRNAALASSVVELLGGEPLSVEEILQGAETSLPGRLDICPSPVGFESITFVDDALASNPSATAAGLEWALVGHSDVVVILGGDDRGVSIEPLLVETAQWNETPGHRLRAITLPRNGQELADRCGIEIIGHVDTVADAVPVATAALATAALATAPLAAGPRASDLAASRSQPTAMVLFSPAAPTPAGHGNWKTRSNEFRAAIAKLSQP